ncbi:MAG TPA: hypothetical protein VEX39_16685 [Thermoleophilaceae bacterium]|nr:hypothetical protein [Thermoleophilaceae bacterium]
MAYDDLPWVQRLDERRDPKWDSFSWLTVRALYDSVNDVIAKKSHDVVNRRRARWISAQRAAGYAGARTDTAADAPFKAGFVVDRSDQPTHLLVVGDTGEADASQYVVIEPLLSVHGSDLGSTDFMVILSDVVYPAGDVNDYVNGFFIPYRDYDKPIHALPGNHDWYDGLNGFMYHFCAAEPLPRVGFRATSYRPGQIIARTLWRGADEPDRKLLSAYRHKRAIRHGLPAAVQPAPYYAIDTEHVRIVAIDTGISGEIDAEQARWLLEVSNTEQPKILLTGKPIYVDNEYRAGTIDWDPEDEHAENEVRAMTVDDIVRDPDHHYVAALGGDVHNYQRYPVNVGKRTIQYIVSGGGGAYLSGTHRIPLVGSEAHKPDHRPPDGPLSEDEFRCYPLRGDCLAYFARRSGPRLAMGFLWAFALLAAGSVLFLQTVPLDGDRRETIAAGFALVLLVGLSVGLAGGLKRFLPDGVANFLSVLLAGGAIAVAVARLVQLDRGELWAVGVVALGAPLALVLATMISYEARRSVPPFLPAALIAAPIITGVLLTLGAPEFGGASRFERALIWGLVGGLGLVVSTACLRRLRERVHAGRLMLRDRGRENRGRLAAALALWDLGVVVPWTVLAVLALADRWDHGEAWVGESVLVMAGALVAIGLAPLLVPAAQQKDPRADGLVSGLARLSRAAKAAAGLAIFGLVTATVARAGHDRVAEAFLDGVAVTVAVLGFAFYLLFAVELRSIVGWAWVTVLVVGVVTLTIGVEPLVLALGVLVIALLLVLLARGKLSRAGGFRTMLALREGDINADEAAALVAKRLRPGEKPTRGEPAGPISDKARRIADVIYPSRLGRESLVAKFVAELSDTNEPPFFKNFLRIDVEDESDDGSAVLKIRCYGVTGFEGKAEVPSVEDSVSIELKRLSPADVA